MPERAVEPSAVSTGADPSARSARSGLLAAVGVCALLASAVLAFLAHRVAFFPIDLAISRYVQAAPIGWLDPPLRALNALGFVPTVDIVYGGIIGILFAVGWRWEAMASGFAVLGSAGLSHLVKVIVERPRPPMNLIHVEHHITNPTFPAGHVLNFTAFAGFLCYLAYARLAPSRHRAALIAVLLTTIGLMGLARIRAGEHWPSDVLGGYLLGVVWLAATAAFYRWGIWRERGGQGSLLPKGLTRNDRRNIMKVLMLAMLGVAVLASGAQAQTGRHVAIGLGLGLHKYVDKDFSQKNPGYSIIYRLALKPGVKQGWVLEPKGTIDWFKTDVQPSVGAVRTHIGKLRSIPVLVGAGPSYRHGRTKVGVAVLVGPSFNHFTADNSASSITVKNSFLVRPETSLWYDVSSRLGLHAGVGYVYNRPTAETTVGGTTTSAKWKTDHVNFGVGFAVGIF